MAINYKSAGEVVQHTAAEDIASAEVVRIGKVLGVALSSIATGETGSVKVQGIFEVPKVSGAVIAQGDDLTWDSSAGAFDDNAATPAVGDVTGPTAWAAESAGDGIETIRVKFTGVPGTVA